MRPLPTDGCSGSGRISDPAPAALTSRWSQASRSAVSAKALSAPVTWAKSHAPAMSANPVTRAIRRLAIQPCHQAGHVALGRQFRPDRVQFRLDGGVKSVGEQAPGEGQIDDQRLGEAGELPNAASRAQPAGSATISRARRRRPSRPCSGRPVRPSAPVPTRTALGSAGFGGMAREDGTGIVMVDTIGTRDLAEGCLRLRADPAKVNRSACDMQNELDGRA